MDATTGSRSGSTASPETSSSLPPQDGERTSRAAARRPSTTAADADPCAECWSTTHQQSQNDCAGSSKLARSPAMSDCGFAPGTRSLPRTLQL